MAQHLMLLLECPICTDIFDEADRKPKVLPCQHTICLFCMKQLAHHDIRQDSSMGPVSVCLVLKCPTCNAEYDAPENDVDKFPNNITMISLLSVAPHETVSTPKSRSHNDDIKHCLEERVRRLRDKVTEARITYAEKMSAWEKQIEDAKKSIHSHCIQFKQAIDHREVTLITKLDKFSAKRQTSYEASNAEFTRQLTEMNNFCDQVERQRESVSEREATQNLDQCLEMLETLEGGDESGKGETNGEKWVARFNPDRKDTVHASIAMFGQLYFQEPGSEAKDTRKTQALVKRTNSAKRVYTRDFLLKIQPHCCSRKPATLAKFPQISPAMMDVTSMLELNQEMLERRPTRLHLLNIHRQPEVIPIEDDNVQVTARKKTTSVKAATAGFHHQSVNQEDWSPPRLFLGNSDFNPSYSRHTMSVFD